MAVPFDEYRPFDSGAGKDVREAGWRSMMRHVLPDGPLISGLGPSNWGTQLQPYGDGGGMLVKVRPGEVWVRGHHGAVLLDKQISVPSNPTGSIRYDAVVARADFINDLVELDIVTGTSSTTGPALVQDSTKWEVLIAIVTVPNGATSITAGNVADRRSLVGYSEGTYVGSVFSGATNPITAVRYRRVHGMVEVWFRHDTGGGLTSPTFSLPYPHGHTVNDVLGVARIQNNPSTGAYNNFYVTVEADATTSRFHLGSNLVPAGSADALASVGTGGLSVRGHLSYTPAQ